jgi:hypothetical protein
MTDDKPMISSEIEITPALVIMFFGRGENSPWKCIRVSDVAQKYIGLKITVHGRKAHSAG